MECGNRFENLFLELVAKHVLAWLELRPRKRLRAASRRLCDRLRPYVFGKEYAYRPLYLASREEYGCCRAGFGPNIAISLCHVPSPTELPWLLEAGADIMLTMRGTRSPDELTRCLLTCEGSLVELNIIHEPYTDPLDHPFRVALGRLARLEVLNLSGYTLISTDLLKGLRLKKLDLAGCGLTCTTALRDLPSSLTALNVSTNYLHPDSISRLAGLTQLTKLNVSNAKLAGQNPLESLAGLARLVQLTELDVSDCSVQDFGDILSGRLPALERLNAAGNAINSVVHIACGLKELDLTRSRTRLTLTGQLSTLTKLRLGCSSVFVGQALLDPSMEALASAHVMEVLEISSMSMGEPEILEALMRGKRRLSQLVLKSVWGDGNIAVMTRMLPSLARLTWLNLDSTSLGVAFVNALDAHGQPMAALTTLILSSQCVSIDGDIFALVRALQLMPALKALNMRGALRRADSVRMVLKCAPESLTEIDLAYNSFYPIHKGQAAARIELELCMVELRRFADLTSVAILDPYNTNLSLVAGVSGPPTIVETVN